MPESESNSSYLEGITRLVDGYRLLGQQNEILTKEISLLKNRMEAMVAHAQAIIDLNFDVEISEPRELAPIFKQQVEELDSSVRLYNCLKASGILTIGDLVQKTEKEMFELRNFGKKTLDEVRTTLATQGLRLEMNREDMLAWTPPDPANPLFR